MLTHLETLSILGSINYLSWWPSSSSGWNSSDSSHTIVYNNFFVGSKLSQLQSNGSSHVGSASSLCSPSKYGCFKHCLTVYRFSGLNISILLKRFRATGLALGYFWVKLYLDYLANFRMYFLARSLPINAMSSCVGVPKNATVLLI